MNEPIDWDEVAEAADNTCRSLLAEVLGRVDEFDRIIILARDVGDNATQRSWTLGSEEELIGMMELAKFRILREAADR